MCLVLHRPYSVARREELVPLSFVRPGKPAALARREAASAFLRMMEAASSSGIRLVIVSSFRSLEDQGRSFSDAQRRHGRRRAVLWVAPPGYSEHHTGHAFDIGDWAFPREDDEPGFEETPAFRWLEGHAADFGFELSFPPGNLGRVGYEPWHWRFVGGPEAGALFHPGGIRAFFSWARAALKAVGLP